MNDSKDIDNAMELHFTDTTIITEEFSYELLNKILNTDMSVNPFFLINCEDKPKYLINLKYLIGIKVLD